MKLVGSAFLERFGGRMLNTHPALLPAFPGMHGARDALAHGVKVTGSTLFVVDGGVDTGPIVAQRVVEVRDDDDEASLHERIKVVEREMLVDTVGRMAREGWTVTWKGRGWDRSMEEYLALVRIARDLTRIGAEGLLAVHAWTDPASNGAGVMIPLVWVTLRGGPETALDDWMWSVGGLLYVGTDASTGTESTSSTSSGCQPKRCA